MGGALGGLFNALLAPIIFDRLLEYPLALGAALLLTVRTSSPGFLQRRCGGSDRSPRPWFPS